MVLKGICFASVLFLLTEVCGKGCKKGFEKCSITCCCQNDTKLATCGPYKGHPQTYIPELPQWVEKVYFRNNFISKVSRETFKNISKLNLKTLKFNTNGMETIDEDSFLDLKALQELDLSYHKNVSKSDLEKVLARLPNKNMDSLTLKEINLQSTELFANMIDFIVTKIDLQYNKVVEINWNDFDALRISHMAVANNKIEASCHDYKIMKSQWINMLSLRSNMLVKVPDYICNGANSLFPRLQHLDLSDNAILIIRKSDISCLKNLTYLHLTENSLRKIETNTFASLPKLKSLFLNKMPWLIRSNIRPFTFNSSSLRQLRLDGNKIKFANLKAANELFKYCPNLELLNIDLNTFESMADHTIVEMLSPLTQLQTLSMNGVKLMRIPGKLLGHLSSLQKLYIDGNWINNFNGSFNNITSILELSIQGNRIMTITPNSFPPEFLRHLKELNLADNPFDCSCDLLWFKNKIVPQGRLDNVSLLNWPRRYTCASPPSVNRVVLKYVALTEELCTILDNKLFMNIAIAIGSFCFVLLVVVFIVQRNIWYVRYLKIKIKRYSKAKSPETQPLLGHPDLLTRVYVIYHDEDGDFVHGYLRKFSEETNDFRLYIRQRDAPLGDSMLDVMAEAIYSCASTIVVLSDHFLAEGQCLFQLDIALDRHLGHVNDNMLFVILDNLEYKNLSKTWCVLLTKHQTAEWCTDPENIKRKVFEQQLLQLLHNSPNPNTIN